MRNSTTDVVFPDIGNLSDIEAIRSEDLIYAMQLVDFSKGLANQDDAGAMIMEYYMAIKGWGHECQMDNVSTSIILSIAHLAQAKGYDIHSVIGGAEHPVDDENKLYATIVTKVRDTLNFYKIDHDHIAQEVLDELDQRPTSRFTFH